MRFSTRKLVGVFTTLAIAVSCRQRQYNTTQAQNSQDGMESGRKINGLYVNAFGNPANKTLIFVHGGPIGHSHGAPISLKTDQLYPGMISKIILVSGPVNFWKSLDSIRINCTSRYATVGDIANTDKINADFSTLNSNPSLENEVKAVAEVFQLGQNKPCALYTPSQPTKEAIELRKAIVNRRAQVAQENLFLPMPNFIINERYIYMDQTQWVKDHANYVFGIYGSEDGLFTPDTLAEIESSLSANLSSNRFQLIKNASHAIYIDQQRAFIDAVKNTFN